jgi:hypothetical protein
LALQRQRIENLEMEYDQLQQRYDRDVIKGALGGDKQESGEEEMDVHTKLKMSEN